MKTRSIQTLLLAATLGLLVTACNNDSDQTVDITKPINVKLSLTTTGTNIPISRAAIGATEFDDDDALGLYIAHKTGANDESPISASLDPKNTKWVNGSFPTNPSTGRTSPTSTPSTPTIPIPTPPPTPTPCPTSASSPTRTTAAPPPPTTKPPTCCGANAPPWQRTTQASA